MIVGKQNGLTKEDEKKNGKDHQMINFSMIINIVSRIQKKKQQEQNRLGTTSPLVHFVHSLKKRTPNIFNRTTAMKMRAQEIRCVTEN